jgi:hypothetical protein
MAAIQSRQDLADYALRSLGGGVVNVEVSADQIEDAITSAVDYYHEFHFDALERDYISHKVTGTDVTVASSTGFAVGDTVTTTEGGNASIVAIVGNVITTGFNSGVTFKVTQTLTNGTASSVISSVKLGDIDNHYIVLADSVVNVLRIINYSSTITGKDALFSLQFQMAAPEILNMVRGGAGATGGIGTYYGTMNYLSQMDFVLNKQKTFRFNRRVNKLYIDSGWTDRVSVGDYIVIEIYRTFDPEDYALIYNDFWLKKYTTALIKKTLGTNLKKYSGMTLPGGLQYNGQQIYDEAVAEIKELEQELVELQPPLEFAIG